MVGELELVLGTAGMAAQYGVLHPQAQKVSADEWVLALEDLHRLGFTAVDTAPVYGDAEALIGRARVSIPIHTKLSPGLYPIQSLEKSLSRLKRNLVSVVYFHDNFVMDVSQAERVWLLDSARGTLFQELGASIYDEIEFERALAVPQIDVIQVPFNVLDRRFGGAWLTAANRAGKRIFARSVLLQGTLISDARRLPPVLWKLRPSITRFMDICESWSASPIAAAIGYVRQKESFAGIVLGARSPEEASHLADSFSEPLPLGLVRDLDSLATPSWEVTDPRTWKAP